MSAFKKSLLVAGVAMILSNNVFADEGHGIVKFKGEVISAPCSIKPGDEIKRTAILLTLGISLHNFPEGIATFVTASSNLELGFGIALAVALHNIPEGLAVAGPVYAATGSKRTAILWAGISGLAEILGGVLAWLILGSMISPVVMAAIMAAVAGIMVALSVDELMPLAKEIDPNNNPSYGVLCGMSVMGFSLVLLQTAGIG